MEYRELLRTLDNDESVRTFMDGKLNERGEMAQVGNYRRSNQPSFPKVSFESILNRNSASCERKA